MSDIGPDPEVVAALERIGKGLDFFWRQVGTDIEVRVRPDFLASGPAWQHQYAPTGLLTIHLAPEPVDAEVIRADPLEPIETPGPTFIRQAEWDDETQTWRVPGAAAHQTWVFAAGRQTWAWKCHQCSAAVAFGSQEAAEADAALHRAANP